MKHKIIVGLTGNIATGKSTIMQLAAAHGAETIDADKVAHSVLKQAVVKHDIRLLFGAGVFAPDGEVDRAALGKIVFSDAAHLRALEAITHPAVRRQIAAQIAASHAPVVFVEAIKLLEGPLKDAVDQIWVTFCSPYTQIERLTRYRGLTIDEARQRVQAQGAQEAKIAAADVVIDTNGELSATQAQFEQAWAQLLAAPHAQERQP